jgi:death on curing protein
VAIVFLSVQDVLQIHREGLETYGGESGLRDIGLLESAVHAPQSVHYYDLGDSDPQTGKEWALLASAYWFHISANHPFVDGNKRAAFMRATAFLYRNGFSLDIQNSLAYNLAQYVAESGISRSALAEVLAPRVLPAT